MQPLDIPVNRIAQAWSPFCVNSPLMCTTQWKVKESSGSAGYILHEQEETTAEMDQCSLIYMVYLVTASFRAVLVTF